MDHSFNKKVNCERPRASVDLSNMKSEFNSVTLLWFWSEGYFVSIYFSGHVAGSSQALPLFPVTISSKRDFSRANSTGKKRILKRKWLNITLNCTVVFMRHEVSSWRWWRMVEGCTILHSNPKMEWHIVYLTWNVSLLTGANKYTEGYNDPTPFRKDLSHY